MTLREHIHNISTNWREILLKILDKYPLLEETYNLNIKTGEDIYPVVLTILI